MLVAALPFSCSRQLVPEYDQQEQRRLLSTIAPTKIDILDSLTQPVSFDQDGLPDGVEVVIAATDGQAEPSKLVGQMVFELYTHRQPSADPKGQQLQTWQVPVTNSADQEKYWNRATRQYEFPLKVNAAGLPRQPKFVLVARYTNPWNEHLEDEALLDLSSLISELKAELRSAQGE